MKKKVITLDHIYKSFDLDREKRLKRLFSNYRQVKNRQITVIKDVSFDVKQGERVGLFGPNGSGKSTILRLIAKILKPDSGNLFVEGKIAPVIELGSGLHPELTGHDNIFLYASILGMSRQRIISQLNKIISFSELNEFINMPIKKYSSGMKARLAFSVAIFSDVDILLFDEVFAVGDNSFRDKSMRALNHLGRSRTIILTSHDLGLMQQVCDRILILDRGKLLNEQNEISIEFLKNMPTSSNFIAEATSNSMYPLIKTGDSITIERLDFKSIKAGDIIAFYLLNLPEIIVHRVVDTIDINGEKTCITKGDSFFGLDAWEIQSKNFLGRVTKIGEKNIC